MDPTRVTPLELGFRVQLPADWARDLGLQGRVRLDKTAEGILIRPCPPANWDEFFANKLPVGQTSPESEDLEIHTDDLFL